jgi:hypothetical protein
MTVAEDPLILPLNRMRRQGEPEAADPAEMGEESRGGGGKGGGTRLCARKAAAEAINGAPETWSKYDRLQGRTAVEPQSMRTVPLQR